ncbi:group III truncated hemoglobin [Ferruginibacter sp. SUN002]|uniref:group III truncated hemoglobin n=1 Tax=Ferruginibacter sp. SUN002 TaxID=2937789 RepID=UPI003D35A757
MKKDIETITDIQLLVNAFYEKVKADKTIGYIFNDVVKVNWEKHLPVMYNFWENTLFFTGTYEGNPMELHKQLHRLTPLTAAHFKEWTLLFTSTVDELFSGTKAELAKQRALSIATIMQVKIFTDQSSRDTIF